MGWVFLQLPCLTWSLGNSSSVSSIICDKNSSMERRRLSPSPPMSACETTVRRSKRDGLGEWGGLLGLWLTGLSWWDRGYQFEGRPATYMSTELKILTSPMSADFGTCDTSGRRDSSTTTRNCCKIRDITTTKGVRMDPRLSGVALTSTCGRRVAVDVVLGSLAEMPT